MKFLIETLDHNDFTVISEAKEGGKKEIYIEGPFLQADIINANGREYPMQTMRREVAKYMKEKVLTNRACGELNHPNHPEVNPERAAIKIESLIESGNNFIGKAKVMQKLPMGQIVAGLIGEGVQLGVSSRGLGSVRQIGNRKVVQEDFKLMTAADVVSDPSAPDAFVTALMEGKDWVYENGILREKETEFKQMLNKASKAKCLNEAKLLEIFNHILSQIK
jgi:hypothetical protein